MKQPSVSRYKIDRTISGERPFEHLNAAEKLAHAHTLKRYQHYQTHLPTTPKLASLGAKLSSVAGVGMVATGLLGVAVGVTYLTSEVPTRVANKEKVEHPLTVARLDNNRANGALQTMVSSFVKSAGRASFEPLIGRNVVSGDVLQFKVTNNSPASEVYLYAGVYVGSSLLQHLFPSEVKQPRLITIRKADAITIPVQYLVTPQQAKSGVWIAISNRPFNTDEEFSAAAAKKQTGTADFSFHQQQSSSQTWIDHHFIEFGESQ